MKLKMDYVGMDEIMITIYEVIILSMIKKEIDNPKLSDG